MSLTPLFINKPRMHSAPPPSLADEQARLAQEQRELEQREQRAQQRAERRRAEAEATAADLRRAMDIDRPRYTASLISKAAAKGRGETVELTPLAGLAAQIVFQGKVRRGEAVADAVMLPENLMARAVVLSGRRRRGEALSDAEQNWLNSFLKRAEG
jgi:hypothetical protein